MTFDAVTKSDAFPWTFGNLDILMSGTDSTQGATQIYTRALGAQWFTPVETIAPQVDTLTPPVFAQSNERIPFAGLPFTTFQVNSSSDEFFGTTFQQPGEIWLATVLQTPQQQWRLSETSDKAKFEDEPYLGRSRVWVFHSSCPKGSELRSTIINLRRCDTPIRAPDHGALTRLTNGSMHLVFSNGFPGTQWNVQASPDLDTWLTVSNATETSPGVFEFTDTAAAEFSKRFYRIRSAP